MLGQVLGTIGGAIANKIFGDDSAKDQYKAQKEFAQHGIRWKVNDALKAGVHPLYALGANTVSYSPVSVGGSDFAAMGADIGRSVDAVSTSDERLGSAALQRLALERAGLENDLLRANIAGSRVRTVSEASQIGPPMPGLIPTKSVDPQQIAGVNIGGAVKSNPFFSDAQNIEDRYGDSEVLSMLSALGIGAADAYWNLFGSPNSQSVKGQRMLNKRPARGYPRYGGR